MFGSQREASKDLGASGGKIAIYQPVLLLLSEEARKQGRNMREIEGNTVFKRKGEGGIRYRHLL